VLRSIADAGTVWSEWEMSGTRRDGAEHLMRGMVIFEVTDGRATAAPMSFNELAASLAPELGASARHPRHLPRAVLRCVAVARSTPPGRQAHSALIMDSYDLETGQPAR
jgi:hypothetical protein